MFLTASAPSIAGMRELRRAKSYLPQSVGSKEGEGGGAEADSREWPRNQAVEMKPFTGAALISEEQTSHTREARECWSSTSSPPTTSGGHKPFLTAHTSRVKTAFPPTLWAGLPCSLLNSLSSVAGGQ